MIYWIQVVVQAWEHMFSDKTLVQIKAPGKSRAEMPCFFCLYPFILSFEKA